uniref:DDE_3 domain-containing protein n=1 Tax=Caenorhabditis japonica TaxID=281687 RepID=A0A8R1EB77_CAEJA
MPMSTGDFPSGNLCCDLMTLKRICLEMMVSSGFGVRLTPDNDPKHTSLHVRHLFSRRSVTVLSWPGQSPDLNVIEPLWEELERRLRDQLASNADQKLTQLKRAWPLIPQLTIDALIDSMPRRCQAVIDHKGYIFSVRSAANALPSHSRGRGHVGDERV